MGYCLGRNYYLRAGHHTVTNSKQEELGLYAPPVLIVKSIDEVNDALEQIRIDSIKNKPDVDSTPASL